MNKFYPNAAAALKGPNGIQETYILKHGIVADLALVKAWKADTSGNVVFRKTIDTHTLVWWTFSPGKLSRRARGNLGQ